MWGSIASAVAGPLVSSVFGGGGSGGSGSAAYTPASMGTANQTWIDALTQQQANAANVTAASTPAYQQSLQAAQGINYAPLNTAATSAGQQYGNLATTAQGQAGMFGQQAALAGGQQQALYNAGNQVYQQALDPQNAQFNLAQQNLGGQINAAQAQRGLGNSPVGAQEYGNIMSNFDTQWNAQKLANMQGGLQSMAQGSQAGGAQGQLQQQGLQGQLLAGQAGAGYTMQGAQTPMQAQQFIAQQPAAAANAYGQNMGQLTAQQQLIANQANAYMAPGAYATQAQNAFSANQNQLLGQGLGGIAQGVGSWLNNMPSAAPATANTNIFAPTSTFGQSASLIPGM